MIFAAFYVAWAFLNDTPESPLPKKKTQIVNLHGATGRWYCCCCRKSFPSSIETYLQIIIIVATLPCRLPRRHRYAMWPSSDTFKHCLFKWNGRLLIFSVDMVYTSIKSLSAALNKRLHDIISLLMTPWPSRKNADHGETNQNSEVFLILRSQFMFKKKNWIWYLRLNYGFATQQLNPHSQKNSEYPLQLHLKLSLSCVADLKYIYMVVPSKGLIPFRYCKHFCHSPYSLLHFIIPTLFCDGNREMKPCDASCTRG